jgi:hypothetical protein
MMIETLEDRRLLSTSPWGINLSVNYNKSTTTLSLNATQSGTSNTASATLNTTTGAYSYDVVFNGHTLIGSGTL